MRNDAQGMFWDETPKQRTANRIAAIMPEIPVTGWMPPPRLPDLSCAKVISLDTETYDPDLLTKGPGWARGVGHMVGVSLSTETGAKWYIPIRHEIEPLINYDPAIVIEWLKRTLGDPKQPKVGANLLYDLGWLKQEGVDVKGELMDVQYAEALLDETASVGLETLGQKYLDEGKDSPDLYQWCADYYGGKVNSGQRKNIYRAPARLVGPYAESDADLPLRIIQKQWGLLEKEGLMDIFKMECALIPMYVEMRFAGVTVNVPYAEKLSEDLLKKELGVQQDLEKLVGFGVNVNAPDSLTKIFDSQGLKYGHTALGTPSFTKDFLAAVTGPVGGLINEIRKFQKLRGTFVDGYILDSHVNGKVHGQFHPLRNEDGGTRSGRYSSSMPNLQNIPSNDPELAPMIRGLFIPDVGHKQWRKYDYAQIEYRFMVHYAVGKAGDEARAIYAKNPDLDYHKFAQDLVFDKTGMSIKRKPIKRVNFGLIYGMGKEALRLGLGLSKTEGNDLFTAYFDAVAFAKPTMDFATREALETGVIKTFLGRKSRFDLWESTQYSKTNRALPLDKAIRAYGSIRRAATHKALNRRLQGSAADQLKAALHKCYKDGIYDDIGVPRMLVHDECNHSDPGGKDEGFKEMRHIFETVLPLKVPIKFDYEKGPDWGHVEDAD